MGIPTDDKDRGVDAEEALRKDFAADRVPVRPRRHRRHQGAADVRLPQERPRLGMPHQPSGLIGGQPDEDRRHRADPDPGRAEIREVADGPDPSGNRPV